MKVYCIINSNAESYDLIGIYDNEEDAKTQCEQINQQLVVEHEELQKRIAPSYFPKSDWNDCHVRNEQKRTSYSEGLE